MLGEINPLIQPMAFISISCRYKLILDRLSSDFEREVQAGHHIFIGRVHALGQKLDDGGFLVACFSQFATVDDHRMAAGIDQLCGYLLDDVEQVLDHCRIRTIDHLQYGFDLQFRSMVSSSISPAFRFSSRMIRSGVGI